MVRLAVLREGRALIYIPDTREAIRSDKGLEPAWLEVFYNPVMEFNRDLSVLLATSYSDVKGLALKKAIDAMAGTGVRGIRYLLEVKGLEEAIINDSDPRALEFINRNVTLNQVSDRSKPSNRDANALMFMLSHELGEGFDIVDIDPFGSPAPFISASISLVHRSGLLLLTATDLAVLGGSKRMVAARKYLLTNPPPPLRSYRETAIRVLLGYLAREAASHDRALVPVLSFSVDHYLRVAVTFERGATKANRMLSENLGYIVEGKGGAVFTVSGDSCQDSRKCYGPIWIGRLADPEIVKYINDQLSTERYSYMGTVERAHKVLGLMSEELKLQEHFHQRLDMLCSAQKHNMPRLEVIEKVLRNNGYAFSRTHLGSVGFRTDAPPEFLSRICSLI